MEMVWVGRSLTRPADSAKKLPASLVAETGDAKIRSVIAPCPNGAIGDNRTDQYR
jgi:hypothetical protein